MKKAPNGWNKQIEEWKKAHPVKSRPAKGKLTPPVYPGEALSVYQENAIICTGVSQNQMWTAQFSRFDEPRTFISSGGLGTMGYGLGLLSAPVSADPTGEL